MDQELDNFGGDRGKTKLLYEKIKNKNFSKKVELTPRDCTRFNERKKDMEVNAAMIYLKLRDEECRRKKALTFSGKSYCRVDSTKQHFGPPDMRILKIAPSKQKITHNVTSDNEGWLYALPQFEMGKDFRTIEKNYNIEEIRNDALLNKLVKIEDQHKQGFKDKVNKLRQYYLDYLEQTNFKGLSEEDLIKKAIYFRSN